MILPSNELLVNMWVNFELPRIIWIGTRFLVFIEICCSLDKRMNNGMIFYRDPNIIASGERCLIKNLCGIRQKQNAQFTIPFWSNVN